MGKMRMLVIDREVIEAGDILAIEYANDKILKDWIVAIIDDGNFNPLATAIAQMQSAMIRVGLENNGIVCQLTKHLDIPRFKKVKSRYILWTD